jgi:hypothetical protein
LETAQRAGVVQPSPSDLIDDLICTLISKPLNKKTLNT